MTDEANKRLEFLFSEAEKACERHGLDRQFLTGIYQSDDWKFCILAASFIEAVLNEILSRGLKFQIKEGENLDNVDFAKFVERLPMLGRSGRWTLAKICQCPEDSLDFIESLFLIRNAYAHKISNTTKSLLDICKGHPESNKIFRGFNVLANDTDNSEFLKGIQAEPRLLNFAILDNLQRFLALANLMSKKTLSEPAAQGPT
jgi:hypothetical protein